jgi:glutamine cyclotransferase
MKLLTGVAAFSFLVFLSCNSNDAPSDESNTQPATPAVPLISYTITGTYPHDTSSFTEGLQFYNGQLLESTGNKGRSKLLLYDLKTGKVARSLKLDDKFFGEGVCVFRDTIYQLTYQEKTVLVYDKNFKKIKELPLPIEGWGLTTDGTHLIASDGTSNLHYFEPTTFRLLFTKGVTENGMPVARINELEYINGVIYANQWQTNYILKIDVNSGQVVGKMDFSQLDRMARAKNPNVEHLNGIAYDSTTKKFIITGKNWNDLYELQFSL